MKHIYTLDREKSKYFMRVDKNGPVMFRNRYFQLPIVIKPLSAIVTTFVNYRDNFRFLPNQCDLGLRRRSYMSAFGLLNILVRFYLSHDIKIT